MSDEEQRVPDINLETDDVEVVSGDGVPDDPDVGIPDQYKGVSKADLIEMVQKAQAQADAVEAMKTGIADLGNRLSKPVPSTEAAPVKPKTVEEIINEIDLSEINKEFFEEEGPSAGIKRALLKALPQVIQGIQAQVPAQAGGSSDTRKIELLLDDKEGPVFKKYKTDIEALHQSLPANLKSNPQSWDYVLGQVKLQHMDDLVAERVSAEIATKGAPTEPKVVKEPFSETSGPSISRAEGKKRQVRLSEDEVKEMERKDREGLPKSVYLKRKLEEQNG